MSWTTPDRSSGNAVSAAVARLIREGYNDITDALSENVARIAVLRERGALALLDSALAASEFVPCRIAFTGSSTTQGANADTAHQYVNQLVAMMQAAYPALGGTESTVIWSDTATWGTLSAAAGVHGYNAGQGGTTSADYLNAGEITRIGALNPRMVMHMIGSNDFANQMSLIDYRNNVLAAINAIDDTTPGPCVQVLVHSYERFDGVRTTPWSAYGSVLRGIALDNSDRVAFIDMSADYARVIAAADPLDLIDTDSVHQTNRGHNYMARALARALGIPLPRKASTGTGGTAVISGIYQLAVLDTFTRADGALGSTETGQPWLDGNTLQTGSLPLISGGRLATASSATDPGMIVVNTGGVVDMDVSVDMTVVSGTPGGSRGINFNFGATSDRLVYYGDGSNWHLAKLDTNALTVLVTSIPDTSARDVPNRLRVVSRGSQITTYLNNTQMHSYTLTAPETAKYKSYARAGFRSPQFTGVYFDNFIVRGA